MVIKLEDMSQDICIWKKMVNEVNQPEGKLIYCKEKCNGFDKNCDNYQPARIVKKYRTKNDNTK